MGYMDVSSILGIKTTQIVVKKTIQKEKDINA